MINNTGFINLTSPLGCARKKINILDVEYRLGQMKRLSPRKLAVEINVSRRIAFSGWILNKNLSCFLYEKIKTD